MNSSIRSSGPSGLASNGVPKYETVELIVSDIDRAQLDEPFDKHTVVSLQWWLLCRGIKALTSWKKSELVAR